MELIRVRVECPNDFRIVERELAIKEAKRQLRRLIEKGYPKRQLYVNFYSEDTKLYLGKIEVEEEEQLKLIDVDPRLVTIKSLLA